MEPANDGGADEFLRPEVSLFENVGAARKIEIVGPVSLPVLPSADSSEEPSRGK